MAKTELKIHLLNVAKALQPETAPFVYPAHNAQYGVEQDFLAFLKRHPELLTDDPAAADWHYLPVFWTNWHLQHDYARAGRAELQAEVSRSIIDPARTFTICQYDDGPVVDVGTALVFYASRKVQSGCDAPLLCAPHTPFPAPVTKRYLASFVGRVTTHPVRAQMQDALKHRSDVCIHDGDLGSELFAETVRASYLALCPRGYGGSSFRFYEAMQLGVAPCLIGDIDTRPFKARIPWDACSLYARDATELAALLDMRPPEELLRMGARAKEIYDEHLAYQRWCVHVLEDLGITMDKQEQFVEGPGDPESWRKAHEILRDIVSAKRLETGVEIGVAFGGNAASLLSLNSIKRLYGVDPYLHMDGYDDPMNLPQEEFDDLYRRVTARLDSPRYTHIREKSEQAVAKVPGNVDFVFIDADHSYAGVKNDIDRWFGKIRVGGMLSGHDYGHVNFPGVKQAIDEFADKMGWRVHDEGEGVWWIEKKHDARVSFIVPCYNCADTVVDAVESIYQQRLGLPFEIVCTDDCSTDATPQMLASLARRHPEVKVLRHDTNRGGAAARNTSVRNSSGSLIFCLDADNVLAPSSVGLLVAALGKTGCEAAAFAALNYFQIADGVYRELEPWMISAPGNICGLDHVMTTVKTPASSGNYLYTRESYDRAGGYPEGRGAMDAWGFGFRQHATGTRIAVVPNTFYMHRVSPNGYWMTEQRKGMNDINAASVVLEFSGLLSERVEAFLRSPEASGKFMDYVDKKKFAVVRGAGSSVRIDMAGSAKPLRLHLGCGERMLPGYVNIDYPPSEHTVQDTSVADAYADITTLSFPDASVDEVRLHHLFEHFSTAVALALVCRWHSWLKDGGVLCIETPDVLASSSALTDPAVSYKDRQAILRHVFGSHEAHWAVHKDGWYEDKFRTVLGALGFDDIRVELAVWKATRNITVTARKTKRMSSIALCAQAKALLRAGMVDDTASEERLWRVWCNDFDQAYALNRAQITSFARKLNRGQ